MYTLRIHIMMLMKVTGEITEIWEGTPPLALFL
jgi:hypothetical protein